MTALVQVALWVAAITLVLYCIYSDLNIKIRKIRTDLPLKWVICHPRTGVVYMRCISRAHAWLCVWRIAWTRFRDWKIALALAFHVPILTTWESRTYEAYFAECKEWFRAGKERRIWGNWVLLTRGSRDWTSYFKED